MIGKFFRGFLDGSLSTLGIVVGASAASSSVIIAAALGGTLANGISNTVSALSAERITQYGELRRTASAMVDRDLKESRLEDRMHRETILAGLVDGLATVVGGCVPVLPYVVMRSSQAGLAAFVVVVALVFVVGLYLGHVSKRNIWISACKMAILGVAIAGIVHLVQVTIAPQ